MVRRVLTPEEDHEREVGCCGGFVSPMGVRHWCETGCPIPTYRQRRSHSQVTSYEDCPRKYRHVRVEGLPEGGSWWNVGGTACHDSIEEYEHGMTMYGPEYLAAPGPAIVESIFLRHFEAGVDRVASEQGASTEAHPWRAAKKGVEDGAWWREHGPGMVANYIARRDPDRVLLASEQHFTMDVEGVSFTGYIDQLWYNPEHDWYEIDDLKSGGASPSSPEQLCEYAHAVQRGFVLPDGAHGTVGRVSYNWLRRQRGPSASWGLDWPSFYPWKQFAERVHAMQGAELAGQYPPKPSYLCGFCPAWDLCMGVGIPKEGLTK